MKSFCLNVFKKSKVMFFYNTSKKLIFLLLILSLSYYPLLGKEKFKMQQMNCPTSDIVINSAQDIIDFVNTYPNCTMFPHSILIEDNSPSDIQNLLGLSQLTAVGGDLILSNNSQLNNLNGLGNLSEISGDFSIINCASLTNVLGLQSVNRIGGTLTIDNNAMLSAFSNLQNAYFNDLEITNNPLLSYCAIQSVCNFINCGNTSIISNNGGSNQGCQNVSEVSQACSGAGCCPTVDLNFSTQSEIDAFSTNYLNCSNLKINITIEDDGTDPISNLMGLNAIQSIVGNLTIKNNPSLTSLTGLSNLSAVFQGNLLLENNPMITDLSGLSGLEAILGEFTIDRLHGLTNLSGLSSFIQSYGLNIETCNNLTNLDGASRFNTIYGTLRLKNNLNLISIAALELVGMTSIEITGNSLLSQCSINSVCNLLNCQNGAITINNNSIFTAGCNAVNEIQVNCATTACCPLDLYLYSQADVDAFTTSYPNCTTVTGILHISGADITDLSPLSNINTIGGELSIINCPVLTSLDPLNNITSIQNNCNIIQNAALIDLGLDNLTSIGGWLSILHNPLPSINGLGMLQSVGNLTIFENNDLVDLAGFSSLISFDGLMAIQQNAKLVDISGLKNITTFGTEGFTFTNNPLLSNCSIRSVCSYINAGRLVNTSGNRQGCATQLEIQANCISNNLICPKDTIVVYSVSPDSTGKPIVVNPGSLDTIYYIDNENLPACTNFAISRTWVLIDTIGDTTRCVQHLDLVKDLSKILLPKDTSFMGCLSPDEFQSYALTGAPTLYGIPLSDFNYTLGLITFFEDSIISPQQIKRKFWVLDSCTPSQPPLFIGCQYITTDFPNFNLLELGIKDPLQTNVLTEICNNDPAHFCLLYGNMIPSSTGVNSIQWEYNDDDGNGWQTITDPAFQDFCFVVPPGKINTDCSNSPTGFVDRAYRANIEVIDVTLMDTCLFISEVDTVTICCPITKADVLIQVDTQMCEGDMRTINVSLDSDPFVVNPVAGSLVTITWDTNGVVIPSLANSTSFVMPIIAGTSDFCVNVSVTNCGGKQRNGKKCISVDPMPQCGTITGMPSPPNLTQDQSNPNLYYICPGDDAAIGIDQPFANCTPQWEYTFDLTNWQPLGFSNTVQNTNVLPSFLWPQDTTAIFYRIACQPLSSPSACDPCYSDTLEIRLQAAPIVVNINGNSPICLGNNSTLTINNPQTDPNFTITYTWLCNGVVVGTGNSYQANQNGCYWVEASNGCQITTSNQFCLDVCEVEAIISCPLMPNECAYQGQSITLSGCDSQSTCGNTGMTYQWAYNNGTFISSSGCTIEHLPDPAGTIYTLTATDANGCSATTTRFVKPCAP